VELGDLPEGFGDGVVHFSFDYRKLNAIRIMFKTNFMTVKGLAKIFAAALRSERKAERPKVQKLPLGWPPLCNAAGLHKRRSGGAEFAQARSVWRRPETPGNHMNLIFSNLWTGPAAGTRAAWWTWVVTNQTA
jgi:hypothetical protein